MLFKTSDSCCISNVLNVMLSGDTLNVPQLDVGLIYWQGNLKSGTNYVAGQEFDRLLLMGMSIYWGAQKEGWYFF